MNHPCDLRPLRGRAAAALCALLSLSIPLAAAPAAFAADDPRPLMRNPTIHGDSVVFGYGGDLWKAPVAGGTAVRLTIDDGDEALPRFSPDGSLIAFTAEYDGDSDVYVMSAEGGGITRVTWHPGPDRVVGWHPVSGKVLFQSSRHGWPPTRRLYAVAPDGSGLEELPLHEAAWGSVSPDGRFLAYTPVAREHRTWKRYTGGLAQDVHLYEFATREDRRLTDFDGTDRLPMWIAAPGQKTAIYFASDRDRTLNLYRLDPASGAVEPATRHTDYDVQSPSSDGRRIVYELGGQLWVYKPGADPRRIPVAIEADAPEARPYWEDVSDELQHLTVSPSGARALLIARGEVFTVPAQHGPTRNLSRTSGARERWAAWSPDGRWVAYLSDADGEYQIYRVDARGGEPEKLTDLAPGYRHSLRWSPDGSKIAFADHTLRLHYLDVASGEVVEVDRAGHEPMDIGLDEKPIHDFAWSPDGRFLAYSKIDDDLLSQLWIYSVAGRTAEKASDGRYNDFGPVFTRDGKHLLFLSQRRFDPTFDDFEWAMVYKQTTGIYALTLAADGDRLLPLLSDEEAAGEDEAAANENGGGEKAGKKNGAASGKTAAAADADADADVEVAIDFDGLAGRVEPLPVPAGNYRALAAGDGAVFFLDSDEGDFNRVDLRPVPPRKLAAFDYDEREVRDVVEGVRAYALSADGSHLAVLLRGDKVSLLEAGARDAKAEGIDLAGLRMHLDPRAEWRQIFREAWRMERDFFYDPAYHGLDWAAVRDKYERLLPHASSRADVGYLIGEMIGELNTSHTYVFGGQRRRDAERVGVGLLGADFEPDPSTGRYRLSRILRVADWHRSTVPPLAAPGVRVDEGDYLLSVDGEEVTADRNLYSWFAGKAGRQVALRFAADASGTDAREVRVETLRGDEDLRYLDWVEANRRRVEEASDGRLGYVHLPDTYMGSATEFPRTFYAQTRREGLVVDGRFNGGGLDPDVWLERLARRPLNYWTRRYSADYFNPLYATRAHMVMLTNRYAGSGGDMLPAQFRQIGLGPLIGTRTWGGLVGVSMFLEMIDGGGLTAPDYRVYDVGGRWIIENQGVEPDVTVELDPAEMADGRDAQLEAAIDYLLGKLEEEPVTWPEHSAPPAGI